MQKPKKTIITLIFLHILLLVYSLLGICSKLAAQVPFMSFQFIMYYGVVILNLGIYAICWQQIIKRMPLVTAYANKAITVIWGILWGKLFFQESISLPKIIGALIIICGIILVVTDKEGEDD